MYYLVPMGVWISMRISEMSYAIDIKFGTMLCVGIFSKTNKENSRNGA